MFAPAVGALIDKGKVVFLSSSFLNKPLDGSPKIFLVVVILSPVSAPRMMDECSATLPVVGLPSVSGEGLEDF
jgi:hypothetical protein